MVKWLETDVENGTLNDFSGVSEVNGTVEITTENPIEGQYSVKSTVFAQPNWEAAYTSINFEYGQFQPIVHARAQFRIDSYNTSDFLRGLIVTVGGHNQAFIGLTADRHLRLYYHDAIMPDAYSTIISASQLELHHKYLLELRTVVGSADAGEIKVLLDDVEVPDLTLLVDNLDFGLISKIEFGIIQGFNLDAVIVFDNVAVGDYYLGPPPPKHVLTISSNMGGTTNPTLGTHEYNEGDSITVTAIPDTGYVFDRWELDGITQTANPINVTMDADHSIVAFFKPIPTHMLNVNSNPTGISFTLGGGEMSYVTPWNGSLTEGTHEVAMPSNVQMPNGDIYNFKQWENNETNPIRTINLVSDMTIEAAYEYVAPPPAKGNIQIHAFLDGQEIITNGLISEINQTFQTPATIEVDPGTYTIQVNLDPHDPYIEAVTVLEGQTIRRDAQFATPLSPWQALVEWWNRRTPQQKVIVISSIPLSILVLKLRRG